jgi:hypothetical protein
VLPRSAFYCSDTDKYFNCKKCECARVAKCRIKKYYAAATADTQPMKYCCPICRRAFDVDGLVLDKKCVYYECPCGADLRLRERQKVDQKTGYRFFPATAKCKFCGKYGCTKNCRITAAWSRESYKHFTPTKTLEEKREIPKKVTFHTEVLSKLKLKITKK